MSRHDRLTIMFCAGITCAAILFGHGAGYAGAVWAVWGLVMGYVAGSWMQARHDVRHYAAILREARGGDA